MNRADDSPVPQSTLFGDRLGRLALRSQPVLLALVLAAVVVWALSAVTLVMIALLVALVLAVAVGPVVNCMRRRGIPAIVATRLIFLGLLLVLVGIVSGVTLADRDPWTTPPPRQLRDSANWKFLLSPFAGERLAQEVRVGQTALRVLGGYVRGTAIIAMVDAVAIGLGLGLGLGLELGLGILQVPLALPLAAIVFLTAFVPLALAGACAVAVAVAALVTLVTLVTLVALVTLVSLDANRLLVALIVVIIVVMVNQLQGDLGHTIVMSHSIK